MRWAINLGNTSLQIGCQDGARAREVGKVPASEWRDGLALIPEGSPVWAASVNPAVLAQIQASREGVRSLVWSPELGIQTTYRDPSRIGADRLANALALQAQGGLPAISVDCGTATTLEVVDSDGVFLGGAILPGFTLMAGALHRGTAQLPLEEDLRAGIPAVGPSSEAAIQSGVLYGQAGAVERLLRESERELGQTPRVVLCGGAAHLLSQLMGIPHEKAPELTLQGLFVAAERLEPGV